VTFEEAKAVLLDPYALTREDPHVVGKQRLVTLGMGGMGRIVDRLGKTAKERVPDQSRNAIVAVDGDAGNKRGARRRGLVQLSRAGKSQSPTRALSVW
jgi:hypothetical protein